MPDGIYLTSLKQGDEHYAVPGVMQLSERMSDPLHNPGAVPWLDHVESGELVATAMTNNLKEQRHPFNFMIRSQQKVEPATPTKPGAVMTRK